MHDRTWLCYPWLLFLPPSSFLDLRGYDGDVFRRFVPLEPSHHMLFVVNGRRRLRPSSTRQKHVHYWSTRVQDGAMSVTTRCF